MPSLWNDNYLSSHNQIEPVTAVGPNPCGFACAADNNRTRQMRDIKKDCTRQSDVTQSRVSLAHSLPRGMRAVQLQPAAFLPAGVRQP